MDSIIFDVDGTLWDSTPLVAKSWTKVIQENSDLNLTFTSQDLCNVFGQTLPNIAKVIFPTESEERQLELIDLCCQQEHRDLLATPPSPYEGWEEALKLLSAKYKLFLVSNCQAGYIEVFLEATGLSEYFQDHLCPGDTGEEKAANISHIIKRHNLQSPVYVGDTLGDYRATKEAGIPFVFASYGFGQVETPDYTINCPLDLAKLFC